MTDPAGPQPGPQATVGGIFEQVALAASFLTIIPLLDARPRVSEVVAASFGWFPLIGFALGALLCAIDSASSAIMAPTARAIMLVMALTIATGAVHLDGLADAADALGAGRDRARALEIMRDSGIGTFGAIALFFLLIIKISALAAALDSHRRVALYIAPGLARWAIVLVAWRMDYLRPQGAGATLLRDDGWRNPLLASILAAGGMILMWKLLAFRAALVAIVLAPALALILRAFYRRWLGGVTGDLIGAAGEIIETAVMLAISI
jgi:adenosylcobinamide-GDP ribazoletransferase